MLRKVLSYSAGLYAVSLFASLVRIVVKSAIAKNIGKEALGSYAFYMTLIMIGSSLLSFGIRRAIGKQVAGSPGDEQAAPLVIAVTTLGMGASLLLAGVATSLRGQIDWIFVIVLVSVGPYTVYDIARSTLRGQTDQKREILAAFLFVAVQAAGALLMVALWPSARAAVCGVAGANILLGIGVTAYLLRRFPSHWQPARLAQSFRSAPFRSLLFLAAPLWVTEILGIIGGQADQVIVQGRLGYEMLAEYAAAFTFIGILDQPITVMSRVFLMTFSGGHYSELEQYKQVSSFNLAGFSLLGLLVVAISAPLTPLIFTEQYSLVPLLVAILSVTSIFNSVEVLNSSLTIAKDFPQANRDSKIVATILYIPLLFLLVSRYGVIGAACGNVISWGTYAAVHALYMRKRMPEHAAHTLRLMTGGGLLYAAAVALLVWIGSIWLAPVIILLYIGLGHMLSLWNLMQVPEIIQRLLPGRFQIHSVTQPETAVDSKN